MSADPRIRELLEIIVCPQCRGNLTLEGESLLCAKCAVEYPIHNGIPVLLIDAAKKRG